MADLLKLYRGTAAPTTDDAVAGGLYVIDEQGVWYGDSTGALQKAASYSEQNFTTALKNKLDGIAEGANNYTYTLPAATSSALGGVKSGGDVTISSTGVITVKDDSHAHVISNVDGLQDALDGKASTAVASATANGLMSSAHFSKVEGIAAGAEVNQNAFSNITVGSTTIAADAKTDTLTLVAGSNVTITPDATNDKITITATDTTYSAGTGISISSGKAISNSGVRSVSSGATNGTISVNTGGTSAEVAVAGLGSAAYTASSAYDAAGAANTALNSAKTYTDGKIDAIMGTGAAETLDTIGEISAAITANQGVLETLNAAIVTSDERTSWNTAATNAAKARFKTVKVAGTSLVADSVEDTLTITAGSNITLTPTASSDSFSISATDTTYDAATTTAAGLMSAADKAKLDGIAENANNYSLPTASSSTLGGVKTTSTVTSTSGLTACPIISGVPYYKDTNDQYTLSSFGITATAAELNILDGVTATTTELNILDGVTATAAELNYVDGVTSNIQTQLNGKQATITGGASTITSTDLTASRALVSNSSGKVAVSAVTATELGYLDGVTSAIQTQLNAKVPTSRTVNGKALSANITLSASDVGADAAGSANTALNSAKTYTDTALTWTDL